VRPKARPTLVLLAGPNGAGKSTLYETRIAPGLSVPFINADIIQREELNATDMSAAYKAAEIAMTRRRNMLAAGQSFATETVFSHPSKLDLIHEAKALGFRVMVFHVGVHSPDLSVARVGARVTEGGHPVPEEKIRARYERGGALIRKAVLLSDVGHVFDNSGLNQPPARIITFKADTLSFVVPDLPRWAFDIYAQDLTIS